MSSLQGYYRRATANMALGKFKYALKDFEAVMKRKPRDVDAKVSMTTVPVLRVHIMYVFVLLCACTVVAVCTCAVSTLYTG